MKVMKILHMILNKGMPLLVGFNMFDLLNMLYDNKDFFGQLLMTIISKKSDYDLLQ